MNNLDDYIGNIKNWELNAIYEGSLLISIKKKQAQ